MIFNMVAVGVIMVLAEMHTMGVTVVFRGAKTEEIGDTQTLVDTI